MLEEDVKEISRIIFGILSAKEIMDMSVCEINSTKLSGPNTVYDPRMGGNPDSNQKCVTCGRSSRDCVGHFGHILLNKHILHPLFYKTIVQFLKAFCFHCNRLLITEEQIFLCGLNNYKNEIKFNKILEKIEKVDICCHCDNPQPEIAYSSIDNNISMVYKEKITADDMKKREDEIDPDDDEDNGKKKKNIVKVSIILTVEEIEKIFDCISDEDVILLGLDSTRIHPRNLIISVFPVMPPICRPFVLADENICDDDLTNQIGEMIKSNITLGQESKDDSDEKKTKIQKAYQSLKFRISTFYNNSQGKAKHPTNNRPIKGLKERLTGKQRSWKSL